MASRMITAMSSAVAIRTPTQQSSSLDTIIWHHLKIAHFQTGIS